MFVILLYEDKQRLLQSPKYANASEQEAEPSLRHVKGKENMKQSDGGVR
jgi:hypothetical protein